jgi:hypothetical protein
MKPTRQLAHAVKQSIYLDVYGEFDFSRAYTLAKLECFGKSKYFFLFFKMYQLRAILLIVYTILL